MLSILRECLRLGILELFGQQYLYRKDMAEKNTIDAALGIANGIANGIMNRDTLTANDRKPSISPPAQRPAIMSRDVVN